jgi:hypothetical protein
MFVNITHQEERTINGQHCKIWYQELTRSYKGDVYNGRVSILPANCPKVWWKTFNMTEAKKIAWTEEEIAAKFKEIENELIGEIKWLKDQRTSSETPASDPSSKTAEQDSSSKKLLPLEEYLISSEQSMADTLRLKSKRKKKDTPQAD